MPPSRQLREHGVQLVHGDTVQFTGQMCFTQESQNAPLIYGLQQLSHTLQPAVALHTFGHVALLQDSCMTASGHGTPPCAPVTEMLRCFVLTPPPQVLEQVLQLP